MRVLDFRIQGYWYSLSKCICLLSVSPQAQAYAVKTACGNFYACWFQERKRTFVRAHVKTFLWERLHLNAGSQSICSVGHFSAKHSWSFQISLPACRAEKNETDALINAESPCDSLICCRFSAFFRKIGIFGIRVSVIRQCIKGNDRLDSHTGL